MYEIYNVAIIPLILGLVELTKKLGLPVKFAPVVSLVLGLLFGIFYIGADIKEGLVIGLMIGLSATGLYSGTKNSIKKSKDK